MRNRYWYKIVPQSYAQSLAARRQNAKIGAEKLPVGGRERVIRNRRAAGREETPWRRNELRSGWRRCRPRASVVSSTSRRKCPMSSHLALANPILSHPLIFAPLVCARLTRGARRIRRILAYLSC